eukprot:TRINITY_DN1315_c1_g1_i3.p1 TRINITY_DN1315_c1_g1~~TRINITY_DN1315_c1_g1_i3.p1  ORF type:complete len:267 (+),score=30.09 TRINITY_DN1315_c1_g1_i3:114-803(+)
MHFAEKREGEGGRAEPAKPIGVNIPYPLNLLFFGSPPVPSAEKFKGRLQTIDDFEEDSSTGIAMARQKAKFEEAAEHYEKYPPDNVSMKRMDTDYRMQRLHALPHFSDFRITPYVVGYDYAKQTKYWHEQWKHCQGNLGDDHPTCKKASWYYVHGSPSVFSSYYEETEELGFHDLTMKYGIKNRPSFLPSYQPVKKNIPGAYEFYNSKTFFEQHLDEHELPKFPFTLVE